MTISKNLLPGRARDAVKKELNNRVEQVKTKAEERLEEVKENVKEAVSDVVDAYRSPPKDPAKNKPKKEDAVKVEDSPEE